MSCHFFPTRSIVALVVVFAGAATVTHADDRSPNRFNDDIYAYFDQNRPLVSNVPPTFRKTHPNGLSEREYRELSSPGPAWHSAAVINTTPSASFRQNHPNGLSDREYEALSSNSSLWQLTHPAGAVR